MNNQFKDIPIAPDRYAISSDGKVLDKVRNRLLQQSPTTTGHMRVKLVVANTRLDFLVHRLVALTYLDNPKRYSVVNHIDGNKKNNHYTNLEWVSHSENNLHAGRAGLSYTKPRVDNKFGMPGIRQMSNNKYLPYINTGRKVTYGKVHEDLESAKEERKSLIERVRPIVSNFSIRKNLSIRASLIQEAYKHTLPIQKTLRAANSVLNTTDDIGSKIDDAKSIYENITGDKKDNIPNLSLKQQAKDKATEQIKKTKTYNNARADINRRAVNAEAMINQKINKLKQ